MVMKTSTAAQILAPDEVADLVVRPVFEQSVAAQVCTVIHTSTHELRVPIVAADPSAAWVAEGEEITPSDVTLAEVLVTPRKVAGLTIISRELADDSSPEAASVVGDGLARDIARKIDAAFFGNTTPNGPSGLGSLTGGTGATAVFQVGSWSNVDPFASALAVAEAAFTRVDSWVANPTDALQLALVKKASGSNEPLLGNDVTAPGKRTILGVPLLVSPSVAVGTVWGIPRNRALMVVREDTTVDVDSSAFFTSDRVAIRAIMRVGLGFTHPPAIAKISLS